MLHTVEPAPRAPAPGRESDAPSPSPSALRGMSFDAGSAALAPVQMNVAAASGQLTGAQVSSAVRYNKGRGLTHAQWRGIQAQVGTAADGLVGPNTVRAVARWQASHGLTADGKVGPATLGKINAGGGGAAPGAGGGSHGVALGPAQVTAAVRYNKGRGFSAATVRTIQQQVGSPADGVFGPNTVRAIATWQRSHGLEVDGKVGPATAGKLGVKAGGGGAQPVGGSNSQKLSYAKSHATAIGLRITSTTGGKHAPNSYHYQGRAIDVAGSASKMRQFYHDMHAMHPTELFYDPLGGVKNGKDIGAIGGHGDHVHVAF
ncbi:MAG: hypothetical protein CVU56_16845 [Deltaproteobacteria bacterium HGW-Deltaproteobacteria-14]|jgi:peptidoglycan hydrolase-like protein with peptidoglycan-binding domain|nr:MAG: hypothetical protein CVU56_16845 [Deltaproteobacteria bacterium HGW-Deltaproteobacteria-14]